MITALCAQTQTNKNIESVALQRFQCFYCGLVHSYVPLNKPCGLNNKTRIMITKPMPSL